MESILQIERTKEQFNYDPTKLSNGSGKKVIIICDVCGDEKIIEYRDYIRKRGLVHSKCKALKTRKTCLDRYGVDNVGKLQENIDKAKRTNRLKRGVDWPLQSKDVKDKVISNNLKNYGVKWNSQREDVIKKIQNNRKPNFNYKQKNKEEWLNLNFNGSKIDPEQNLPDRWSNGTNRNIKVICSCGRVFNPIFSNFILRSNFTCGHSYQFSKYEVELKNFLEKNSIKVIHGNKSILNGKELDLFLPEYNIGIEINGLRWHGEINGGKNKYYHLNKTKQCELNGIRLIHVFEDEIRDKKDIVYNLILKILNKSKNRIYARKCIIKEVSKKEKSIFLNKYHLKGNSNSIINLGAFYNNKLVGVLSLSKNRVALGSKNDSFIEIIRFCTSHTVIGLFSKFIFFIKNNYNFDKLVSYSDKRWFNGVSYIKSGFIKIKDTEPNYWYTDGRNRYHRFNFRKSVLKDKLKKFDSDKTEWENMKLNGYDRIFDCGNMKFELDLLK